MQLVTHQTTPEGQQVKQLLIEKAFEIDKEFYLGVIPGQGTRQRRDNGQP